MAIVGEKNPRVIRVPALYVWAAGHLAKTEGMHADLKLLQASLNKSILKASKVRDWETPRAKNFIRDAKNSLNKGVIPFVRDELDLSFAALVFSERAEFLLRSDRSRVDCGFLRVSEKKIIYVDMVNAMIRADSSSSELLSERDKVDLLLTLQGLATEPVFYQSAPDDENLLKVAGKKGAFAAVGRKLSCSVSLWNGPQPGKTGAVMGSLNRSLGKAALIPRGDALYLQDLSGQDKLEMTAASLVGQWLLIEAQEFKSFGPLPDLTMDVDQRKVAVDPMPLLKKFTLGTMPTVYAEHDVARHFSKMYPWFVPEDSKTWLESIQP